jgi:hypothetical protein
VFDTQQNYRLTQILNEVRYIQPLFILRSAEQKLNTLNTLLYGNIVLTREGNTVRKGQVNINESARQIIASQLNTLTNNYKAGRITLKNYHCQLNELLATINRVKGLNFEEIK